MHGPYGRRAAAMLAAAAALVGVLSPGFSHAGAGDDVESLRREDAALSARARSVALELYGLESQLERARADHAAAGAAVRAVVEERRSAARQLRVARQTLVIAERRLAQRLRSLYVAGTVDPVEVLLGSGSLEEAIERVHGLEAVAEHDHSIVAGTRSARRRLTALARRLAAREARLAAAQEAAGARAVTLEQTSAGLRSYLAELAERRRLGADRIAALERAAVARARAGARPAAREAAGGPPPARAAIRSTPAPEQSTSTPSDGAAGVRTLTVTATGYALRGRTASGVPVGWGVVAVDPSVIPLGTRMTIPGYGEGVAADTGGAVQGAIIDLWFPSTAQALAWGRRTVTIRLH